MPALTDLPAELLSRIACFLVEEDLGAHFAQGRYVHLVRFGSTCHLIRQIAYKDCDRAWKKFRYSGKHVERISPILHRIRGSVESLFIMYEPLTLGEVLNKYSEFVDSVGRKIPSIPKNLKNYAELEKSIRKYVALWPKFPDVQQLNTNLFISRAIVDEFGPKAPKLADVSSLWINVPIAHGIQAAWPNIQTLDISSWGVCLDEEEKELDGCITYLHTTTAKSYHLPPLIRDKELIEWLAMPGVSDRLTGLHVAMNEYTVPTVTDYIAKLQNLTELSVQFRGLSDDAIMTIGDLEHVKDLQIHIFPPKALQSTVTTNGLCELLRHGKFSLEKFQLDIGPESIDAVVETLILFHPNLKSIEMPTPDELSTLKHINNLTQLEHLFFKKQSWSPLMMVAFLSTLDPFALRHLNYVRIGTHGRKPPPETRDRFGRCFPSVRIELFCIR